MVLLVLAGAGLAHEGCRGQRLGEELLAATDAGDVERARTLIEQGASLETPGFAGRNALILAACKGHTAVVRLILDVVLGC